MRKITHIFLSILILLLTGCTGSKKYFKAAERLEKQGLLSDAAEYYLEALQRKSTNVDARIKLKDVGQKYISNLCSEFFRDYNTQELDGALSSFEKLKDFNKRAGALDVQFDYPKDYADDYQKAVETVCLKNYNQASVLVNQKKYGQSLDYINAIKKYNTSYKNTPQLEIIAVCEPLYQAAINNLENKNYSSALVSLSGIKDKTENYKDSKDLIELATAQQTKGFILFQPQSTTDNSEKEIQDYLFTSLGQAALQKLSTAKIITNTPFQNDNASVDLYNNNNVDLIQAIRKATGADYFYVFDVSNRQEQNPAPSRTSYVGFVAVLTKQINSILPLTEYKPFDYTFTRVQRTFSYDFKYKIINAYSNQIVASQTQNIAAVDAVEYQQFARTFTGDINSLYPYNPSQTSILAQYSPHTWRNLFSARNTLKTQQELKMESYDKAATTFITSANTMK